MYLILLLAEELTAVPAMMPSFCERKPHRAARTAVTSFIFHPVVSGGAAWLVTHRPAENSASTVTNEDPTVIPAGDTTQSQVREGLSTAVAGELAALLLRLASSQCVSVAVGSYVRRDKKRMSLSFYVHLNSLWTKPCHIFEVQRKQSSCCCFLIWN